MRLKIIFDLLIQGSTFQVYFLLFYQIFTNYKCNVFQSKCLCNFGIPYTMFGSCQIIDFCSKTEQLLARSMLLVFSLERNFDTCFQIDSFFMLQSNNVYEIIHLVRSQNFPKNQHFLFPDARTYIRVPGAQFFGKFYERSK